MTVAWGLTEAVTSGPVEHFGYEMYYYDLTGNGGKRFGIRFSGGTTAWVFDNASGTQANYAADSVSVSNDAVVVRCRNASLGLAVIGTFSA